MSGSKAPAEARQIVALLVHNFQLGHSAALALVDELSDEQLRWRPDPGPQSIGWNLWHIAKWDDLLAKVLVARTPTLSHLAPAHQVWDSRQVASRWEWPAGRLGTLDGGTGLADEEAAALKLPAKNEVVGYAAEAFAHLEKVVQDLHDSLLPVRIPGPAFYPTDEYPDSYGDTLIGWLSHCYEHLGTMEALKGQLGMRGAVDL